MIRKKETKFVLVQERLHLSKLTTVSASGRQYSEFYLMKGKVQKAGFDENFLKCADAPNGSHAGMNRALWEKYVLLLIALIYWETRSHISKEILMRNSFS
jgi:hypothetical protein